MSNEIWKPIPGYEAHYEASNQGNIRRINKDKYIVLKSWQAFEYKAVRLSVNNISKDEFVHRLIAKTFIPNPKNKPQVNHIDGDKSNNCASNLEWVTQSENAKHAYATGLIKMDIDKKRSAARLGTEKVKVKVYCKEIDTLFESLSSAGRFCKIDPGKIAYASLNNKSINGLTFCRVEGGR